METQYVQIERQRHKEKQGHNERHRDIETEKCSQERERVSERDTLMQQASGGNGERRKNQTSNTGQNILVAKARRKSSHASINLSIGARVIRSMPHTITTITLITIETIARRR